MSESAAIYSIGVDAATALCHYPEIDFASIILFG
jgi:hypothetical protein